MSDDRSIVQSASLASNNTQIGIQNNYSGLTVGDAVQMAFSMMREYYPQFKEEALADLHDMLIIELEKMKPSDIVAPKPKTAIPVLQNAAITDETEIRELYAKLLASSMNEQLVSRVHPSFTSLINELSAFDAKVLKRIHKINDNIPLATIKITSGSRYLGSVLPRFLSPFFDELHNYYMTSISIENLARLNLINISDGIITSYDYDTIKNHPFVQQIFKQIQAENPNKEYKLEASNYTIQVTDYGKAFISICTP